MTRDEAIELARFAGFTSDDHHAIIGMLVQFAELVSDYERQKNLTAASEACRAFGKSGAVLMAAIRAKVEQ